MSLLLTLIASLVLVGVAHWHSGHAIGYGGTGGSQAIPSHMVRTSAAITLHRGKGRGVQGSSRRRGTSGKPGGTSTWANSCDVAESTTVVALLIRALHPQARAFCLDMAYTTARVALFGSHGARLGACRRFMPGLAAIIAETLLRRTILRDVTQVSALETTLPAELIRHPAQTSQRS